MVPVEPIVSTVKFAEVEVEPAIEAAERTVRLPSALMLAFPQEALARSKQTERHADSFLTPKREKGTCQHRSLGQLLNWIVS